MHATRGNRDRGALNLGCPTSHITKYVYSGWDVDEAREEKRFAIVQRFKFGEFLEVLLDQIGELPQKAPTLRRRHVGPRARFESPACRRDGLINVSAIAFRDVR
jgi:hypothetical protein